MNLDRADWKMIRIGVTYIVVAGVFIAVMLALAGCGGSGPSEQACKAAMKQQYATALATGRQGHEPAECKGLSDAVLQKLAAQVIAGQLAPVSGWCRRRR